MSCIRPFCRLVKRSFLSSGISVLSNPKSWAVSSYPRTGDSSSPRVLSDAFLTRGEKRIKQEEHDPISHVCLLKGSLLSRSDGLLSNPKSWAFSSELRTRVASNPRVSSDALFHTLGEKRTEQGESDQTDQSEQRSPPSERVHRLADEIARLTMLEVMDLSSLIKKKLGLPDVPMGMPMMMPGMMPGMVMPAGQAVPQAEQKEEVEKTAFDVKLEKFDAAAKIKIIKEVRTFTALGLKEAKELVEKTPVVLKKGVSKEEALEIVEKIKAAGGTAVME